jgi:hypothetical protein
LPSSAILAKLDLQHVCGDLTSTYFEGDERKAE